MPFSRLPAPGYGQPLARPTQTLKWSKISMSPECHTSKKMVTFLQVLLVAKKWQWSNYVGILNSYLLKQLSRVFEFRILGCWKTAILKQTRRSVSHSERRKCKLNTLKAQKNIIMIVELMWLLANPPLALNGSVWPRWSLRPARWSSGIGAKISPFSSFHYNGS